MIASSGQKPTPTLQQKIPGTPPPRNRWGRKAGELMPLDGAETHALLGDT